MLLENEITSMYISRGEELGFLLASDLTPAHSQMAHSLSLGLYPQHNAHPAPKPFTNDVDFTAVSEAWEQGPGSTQAGFL